MRFLLVYLSFIALGFAQAPKPESPDEIENLITSLTKIQHPDSGFSPAFGGSDFPPVGGQSQFNVGRLNHGIEHNTISAIPRLVALGPHSLTALLKHLEDKRRTALTITHESMIGGMWYATEVPIRADNKTEINALRNVGIKLNDDTFGLGDEVDISKHEVTVGDVCFSLIGMITNRSYNAVRYQPTACQVINSPTASPVIVKAVRNIWQDKKLPQGLLESLKNDFKESEYQSSGAATRLLFYFPKEGENLINARLDTFTPGTGENPAELNSLVKAIAWTSLPKLKAKIRNILLNHAEDEELIQAGVAAFADPPDPTNLVHLRRLLDLHKSNGSRATNSLLTTALRTFPKEQNKIITGFLNKAPEEVVTDSIPIFYSIPDPPLEIFAPFLKDKKHGFGRYLIPGPAVLESPKEEDVLAYRRGDNFYEIISRALGDSETKCTGSRKEMDLKISSLVRRLELPRKDWPYSPAEIVARQKIQNRIKIAKEVREKELNDPSLTQPQKWFRTAIHPETLAEDFEAAICSLLSPIQWEEPRSTVNSIMINTAKATPRHRDSLTPTEQEQITEALIQRIRKEPSNPLRIKALELSCLLSRWSSDGANDTLKPLLAIISGFPKNHGLNPGQENDFSGWNGDTEGKFDLILTLIRDLMRHKNSKPVLKAFLGLVKTSGLDVLMDDHCKDEFLPILGTYHQHPKIASLIEKIFADPGSPWALSKTDYADANSLGNHNLVQAPAFRKALRLAIADQSIVGSLRIEEDDNDYCWIDWKNDSSSGQGVGKPLGVKPGGPAMDLRFCDALLAGLNNAVFNQNRGPEIRLYWPLKNREASRQKWLKYLDRKN